ncbi:50S ribosomal protein L31 [bacterium]|nr:50S ribosomal protein L31 [bacterium]
MNKEIQPKTKNVKFQCASCGTTFDIESTYHADVCHIDICSHCHP